VSNRLSHEKSPYLLEHAENPVDWFPWGDEAFEEARHGDRPIFLSIGYSSCHWCHVMARESFADEKTAEILNRNFVSIKVDREERPEVDALYMAACLALTGQGGWPLSVFLTPDGRPFFAGTYFPKESRRGLPSFEGLLLEIAGLWDAERTKIDAVGDRVTELLGREDAPGGGAEALGPETLDKAFFTLDRAFDLRHGGFGGAPKFPSPHTLSFLLRYWRRTGKERALFMAAETLRRMRYGGIFDQIGFGLFRYSVDERWRIPHFEKMLVDQALAAVGYVEAAQATADPIFGRVAREIFGYVLGRMTSPEGGFFTAEDADSDGEEGRYYLWRKDEIERLLPADEADLVIRYFGVKEEGNVPSGEFRDGDNILFLPSDPEEFARREGMGIDELDRAIEGARRLLLTEREKRPRPKRDEKIITAPNGLMIAALAKGYGVFGDRAYLSAAAAAADFVLGRLTATDGKLLRRFYDGQAGISGVLEDYAFFVWGLIELYEAGFEVRYLEEAVGLTHTMLDLFTDDGGGPFFASPRGEANLVTRPRELTDGAGPSGNSVAVLNLARLSRLTGDTDLFARAERIAGGLAPRVLARPDAHTGLLCALDFLLGPSREIVIVADPADRSAEEMVWAARRPFLPTATLLFVPDGDEEACLRIARTAPFVSGMRMLDGKATAYVCENYSCKAPTTDAQKLAAAVAGTG
jgi:uncharacterized protein YyaL (SSP411 family)